MKQYLIKLVLCLCVCYASAQTGSYIPNISGQTVIASATGGGPTLHNNDNFGVAVANIGDLNDDGVDDMAVGAINDDNGGTSTNDYGAVYICFMTTSKTVSSSVKIGKGTSGIGSDIAIDDLFGRSIAALGDFNGDGYEDIVVGAYGSDVTGASASGAIYVICLDNTGAIVTYKKIKKGSNGGPSSLVAASWFGFSVCSMGDLNNDGVTDIAVGASGHDATGGNTNGAVYILYMNSDGTAASNALITNGNSGIGVIDDLDQFGHGVACPGDLDDDGVNDLLVCSIGNDDYAADAGCVYLLYMNANGTVDTSKKYVQPFVHNIVENPGGVTFAASIACEDINEDNIPEIFIGCVTSNGFYIMTIDTNENMTGIKKVTVNNHRASGFGTAGLGYGLTIMNDLDNDGNWELVVGGTIFDSPGLTDNGAVAMFDLDSIADFRIGDPYNYTKYGELSNTVGTLDASDQFGASVCMIGDVDGDGYNDVAVGAASDDDGASAAGAVYIIFLDSLQNTKSVQKISSSSGSFGTGLDVNDQFGNSICASGDLDADGVPDLVVGAWLDDDGGLNRGAVWVIYLNNTGTVKSKHKISNTRGGFSGTLADTDQFGTSVTCLGDVNNDGYPDLAVGARQDDDGGSNHGAVWILFLNAADSVGSYQKISDTQGDFMEGFSGTTVSFGSGVSGTGDVNADGIEDMIVGAEGMDGIGAAYVLILGTDGKVDAAQKISSSGNNFPVTLESGKFFGHSVSAIRDLDGDGLPEFLIGQYDATVFGVAQGKVWLVFTDSAFNVNEVRNLDETNGWFNGSVGNYDFGSSLCYYYDTDSLPLVFIGAREGDENSTGEGIVYSMRTASAVSPEDYTAKQPKYAELEKKLDGEVYPFYSRKIRFRYYDKYHDPDDKLTFNLYNDVGTNVWSDGDEGLDPNYGENRFVIDCGKLGADLDKGNYILEVINSKREKYYLRAKLME